MSVLLERYRGVVCDLDGVVYAGPSAVDFAVESLNRAIDGGVDVVFATNNASRRPSAVSDHLVDLGVHTDGEHVINSSMAGAEVLSGRISAGAPVLALGGEGVGIALRSAGFTPVAPVDGPAEADAVLQGYGASITAADLACAAFTIQRGAFWVATNTDKTLPTQHGQAPGNGSLVGAVRLAVDHDPVVAGKPMPVMYEMAARRLNQKPGQVLAIGDRLETDIEGANRGGFDSALVLTGVHGWADAAAAPKILRPTYVLEDLRGLFQPYTVDDVSEASAEVGHPAALRGLLAHLWHEVDSGQLSSADARSAMEAAVRHNG